MGVTFLFIVGKSVTTLEHLHNQLLEDLHNQLL